MVVVRESAAGTAVPGVGVSARVLRDFRLVPVAAAAWVAAGVAVSAPGASGLLAVGLWGGTAAVLVAGWVWRRPRMFLALLGIALAASAMVASQVAWQQPARQAAASLNIGGGRAVTVTATVVGKADRTAAGDVLFDARARRVVIGAVAHAVDVPVSISGHARPDVGDVVTVRGTAVPSVPGRRAVLAVRAQRVTVTRPAGGALAVAAQLRHGLADATKGLPQPGAGLISGLAVGDTGGVSDELDTAMKSSSLSHLTAVSGANCALVVGIAFGLAAWCRARRSIRVAAGLAALTGFVILVTPEPSVVRAAVMAAIAMLGLLLGRRAGGLSLLALSVVIALSADPWLAQSLGFALSVAATGALLTLAAPLARGLSRFLPRALALAVAVPLSAQLACGPLLIIITPTVPLYGVAANMLAEPVAAVGTVLGLVACLTVAVPPLAFGVAALAWLPAAWISAVATTTSSLPSDAVPWPSEAFGATLLAAVGVAVMIALLPPRPGSTWTWLRRLCTAGLIVLAGAGVGTGLMRGGVLPGGAPDDWAILACDIGQGDAILVRSAQAVALIDTGPDPAALRSCLDRSGVRHIDMLVLTHGDHDHIGGATAVIGRTTRVLHGPVDGAPQRRLLDKLAAAGAQLVDAHTGLGGSLGQANWRVLWPRADGVGVGADNQASVVIDVRGGGIPSSLYLGDLGGDAQRALLRTGALRPPYDVVKVAHHGSADQAPELYAALHARLAVISVGAGNPYGHPRARTLAFLHADGDVIARTDRDGMAAVLRTDDDTVRWWHAGRGG